MFCPHVRYVCLYVCMHVCTKSFLKTTTNSSCVCTHLANKADSDIYTVYTVYIYIYIYIYVKPAKPSLYYHCTVN